MRSHSMLKSPPWEGARKYLPYLMAVESHSMLKSPPWEGGLGGSPITAPAIYIAQQSVWHILVRGHLIFLDDSASHINSCG